MNTRLVQAIVLVENLAAAEQRLTALGLSSYDGGRHPGRGTANRIVSFDDHYLELLSVVDAVEAESSPDGRPVLAALRERGPGLARWSVEPDDIGAVGARLGLPVEDRQRIRPDGRVVRWQAVGVNDAWKEPWRCAFLHWQEPTERPHHSFTEHPCAATGFTTLEMRVPDERKLEFWLDGPLPDGVVTIGSGVLGPVRLSLATPHGAMSIGEVIG
jgi:hypothetical protein